MSERCRGCVEPASGSSSSSSTCCPSSRARPTCCWRGACGALLRTRPRAGRELIDRLGLRPVAGSLPHQLSGGEQQRFAIARALVNDPALLLADEPTGNLDVQAGAEVLRLLRAGADEGRAVVMVTHETAAANIADRVLTLRDGLLVEA